MTASIMPHSSSPEPVIEPTLRQCLRCPNFLATGADFVADLCADCQAKAMATKSVIKDKLELSLQERAANVVGYLLWAFEKGLIDDAIGSYRRLLVMFGRAIGGAVNPKVFVLNGSGESDRLKLFAHAIGPLLRNVDALDAGRHWGFADTLMRSLAHAEHVRWKFVAEAVEKSLFTGPQRLDPDEQDEEDRLKGEIADARAKSARYLRLAEGQGW